MSAGAKWVTDTVAVLLLSSPSPSAIASTATVCTPSADKSAFAVNVYSICASGSRVWLTVSVATSMSSTVSFKLNDEIGKVPSFTTVAVTTSESVRAVEVSNDVISVTARLTGRGTSSMHVM